MRNRHRCPKCDHGEVLHVPEPRDANADRMALGPRNAWNTGPDAPLEAYVCIKCGYVELYLSDVRELQQMPGSRVLRAEAKTDPYR